MENATPFRVLTEKQMADTLVISLSTARRWRKTRSGPIRPLPNMGRLVRYSEAELHKYLKGRT